MNSIKKQKVKSKTLHAPIWEFYFQMVYVCPVSDLAFVLANTLEKFLILAPPLAFIFYDTDWSSLAQTAHYFIVPRRSHTPLASYPAQFGKRV
ncbi:MAG: hypothetical protein P4M11_04645 [Candidatus Pacebacteria bacterium]|nr:hypothetical protein [Candidatus Paceibacterota bacterium]